MKAIAVVAFALAVQSVAFAQTPRVASLHGVVVKAGTSEPLAKARVELRRLESGAPAPQVTTTAADGSFTFGNIPPGQYRVVAIRPGYVNAEFGQRRPNGPGVAIVLTAGQSVADLRLTITATAAISGRVFDRLGQPLGNVEVQAMKASYQDGRRVLTRVQSVQSDDRGEYRLFWLAPGRYYVSARPASPVMVAPGFQFRIGPGFPGPDREASGGPDGPARPAGPPRITGLEAVRGDGDTAGLSPLLPDRLAQARDRSQAIYYPGTPDEPSASAIDLVAGDERGAVDFPVDPVSVRRVRGTVVYETNGEPARSARLQWLNASDTAAQAEADRFGPFSPFTTQAVDSDNGRFDLGLAPGSYTLVAAVNNLVGRVTIQVGYADVDDITIPISQGFNLPGRVTFEGRAPTASDLSAFQVSLLMDPPVPGLAPASYSLVLPNGSLTLAAGRGDFRVNIAPILTAPGGLGLRPTPPAPASLENAYVKSIRLGGADVLNGGLHLDGQPGVPLEIVIGTTPAVLDGVAVAENGAPASGVTVVLVPDVPRRSRIDLYRSASSDSAGRFRFEHVPPGDYVVYAWEDVEVGQWHDAEFMRQYEGRGKPLRLGDLARTTIEVPAIP